MNCFRPIGDVADFLNGFAFEPEDWGTEGRPIIRIQNLTDATKPYNRTLREVPLKYRVRKGDLLVSWSATLGVFAWEGEDALLNQHIFKVLPRNGQAHIPYLKYAIEASIHKMEKFTHGSTMKHINRREFLETVAWLPPIEEQQRLATILATADVIKQKRKQAFALADDLVRSTFLEMFGDFSLNPKQWPVVELGDVLSEVRDGPHVSPEYSETGVPFLSTRNVRAGKLILDDLKYVTSRSYEELTRRFKPVKGDVLLTKGGTTGLAKEVDFDWPFAVWVHLAVLRPRTDILAPGFLEACLNTKYCYTQSQRYTHGITNKDLGLTRIRKITICLPPIARQLDFIKIRNQILTLSGMLGKADEEANRLFDSLFQRAFVGELK